MHNTSLSDQIHLNGKQLSKYYNCITCQTLSRDCLPAFLSDELNTALIISEICAEQIPADQPAIDALLEQNIKKDVYLKETSIWLFPFLHDHLFTRDFQANFWVLF